VGAAESSTRARIGARRERVSFARRTEDRARASRRELEPPPERRLTSDPLFEPGPPFEVDSPAVSDRARTSRDAGPTMTTRHDPGRRAAVTDTPLRLLPTYQTIETDADGPVRTESLLRTAAGSPKPGYRTHFPSLSVP
jgi:hypothetical protein